jgi:AraC-like DNA-binding protein
MFALNDGVFVVSDSILRKSSYVPPIALTAIDRQQAAVDYAVNHLRELVLGPSERSVTIVFTALDYENPGAVSYAFRMDDETEWHYIGHNHTASFAGLSPGTYRLLLRSTNGDGVWVDNVRELTIVVTPTFWESWTGRLLMTLLIGGLLALALYTYYYIRRMKRRHHETLEAYLALVSAHTLQPSDSSPCPVEKDASVVMPTQLSASDEAFMARVMDYVETHIGDADANIGDMATATATSRSGLNRKMKSLVGLTPADFLREARIKRAAHLLRTTDDAVADIAFSCGFTDPKYFGKCFKATTAMSPTEYRNAPSDSHS